MRIWMILLFLLGISIPCSAQVILNDSFSDTTKVNVGQTSASYDSTNTLYRLPMRTSPNAIALAEYGTEYAVIDSGNIRFFSYDAGANNMIDIPDLQITGVNPLGIAMRKDTRSLWAFSSTEIKRYDFDGVGMTYNPNLSVLGLNGIMSVSSLPDEDRMAVLSQDAAGKGVVKYYETDATGNIIENPLLTVNTDLSNPVSISTIPGSYDFVVTTQTESQYYTYVPGTGYEKNPFLSTLGLSNVTGHVQNGQALAIIENNQMKRYMFDGSSMVSAPILGTMNTDVPISLSVRNNNYDMAYINDAGEVKYYTFDGSQMVEIPSLGITGLSISGDYYGPKHYESIVVNAGKPCDLIRLTATENNDPGSSITYEVSSDAGTSWTSVTTGSWIEVPEGQQFVLRAELQTINPASTPRLLDVTLEATNVKISELKVTNILFPAPTQGAVPTTTYPIQIRAGSEFTFEVKTDGYVDTLTAILSNGDVVIMTPKQPISDEENIWWGRYTPSAVETTGTMVGITITANFQTWSRNLTVNPFYVTDGSVSMDAGIKLIE